MSDQISNTQTPDNQVSELITDLIDAGVPSHLIGRIAQALSMREAVLVHDEAAERRRAADRERKRAKRESIRRIPQTSAESADPSSSPSPLIKKGLPQTPSKEIKPSPPPSTENDHFDDFWSIWPNKVSKQNALKAWKKLSADDQRTALSSAPDWFRRWQSAHPQASPIHPASYLNQRRWQDEQHPLPRGQPAQRQREPTAAELMAGYADELRRRENDRPEFEDSGPIIDATCSIPVIEARPADDGDSLPHGPRKL